MSLAPALCRGVCLIKAFMESQDAKWRGINKRKQPVKCHLAGKVREGERKTQQRQRKDD